MLKSLRRQKDQIANPANLQTTKATSSPSLTNLAEGASHNNPNAWIPGKTLLKPVDQLTLTEKDLDEEFTRILNANNPHAPHNIARYNNKDRTYKTHVNVDHLIIHFEYDGYLLFKGGDEAKRQFAAEEEIKAEAQTSTDVGASTAGEDGTEGQEEDNRRQKPIVSRNQFNYSERAAQTINHTHRERTTNTEPPPHKTFSGAVLQWTIFDSYMEDLQQKEKSAKEKTKSSKKEDTAAGLSSNTSLSAQSPLAGSGASGNESQLQSHEDYKNNPEVKKVASILERMCNQNTYDEVAQDFKYWDDAADEFREGKGVLLPLWKFIFEKEKKKQVTSLAWNASRKDLFAVGYGSYDFTKQGPGLIACFSLKNPSYPDFVFKTDSGVMCIDFHPNKHSLIVAGLYDGSVAMYDLAKRRDDPLFRSAPKAGKHADPVWQVAWQGDDLDENSNFFSISSDGRVTQWTLLKTELGFTDVIKMRVDVDNTKPDDTNLFSLACGSCFAFHSTNPDCFIVGTEEGMIHRCSKAYNSQYMLNYEGHQMGVYALRYNPFCPNVFLSASADWTVKLWDQSQDKPILSFDLNSSVGDVAWSPVSSSIFAAVTADGKVVVFDLNENKYEPICEQQIIKKAKLTHISFNKEFPIILVGDDKGQIMSFKLSPNLRKLTKTGQRDTQEEKMTRIIDTALGRSPS